jgi:hypothetical protein
MQGKMGRKKDFAMQSSCGHATLHIVNDVATCTDCGQTLGCIDEHKEQSGDEILTIKKEIRTWCMLPL